MRRPRGPAVRFVAAVAGVGVTLVAPATAAAADRYVDQDTGDNTANDCTNPAAPCDNIFTGLLQAQSGETVFVDDSPTAYVEQVTINGGESLVAQEFVGGDEGTGAEPDTIINGGVLPAVTADNAPAGTLSGFDLVAQGTVVDVQPDSSMTIANNVFDDPDANRAISVQGGPTTIDGNTFADSTTTDEQLGVQAFNALTTITDNSFTGFRQAISTTGPGEISRNEIAGTRACCGATPLAGEGIHIQSVVPTLTANHLHSPNGAGTTIGVGISALGPTGAAFQRNRIFDHTFGVAFTNTTSVTFESDVIANNANGITAEDFSAGTLGDFTATNVTLFGNGTDISLTDNVATLNSTIVGDPIDTNSTGATCDISFSRGPTTTAGGNGCLDFQTTANPMFVDPSNEDYHVLPGSPMIEAGDPAPPASGALDLDGDARAIDGDCGGVAERDIGADEFVSNCPPPPGPPGGGGGGGAGDQPDTDPPDTAITAGPEGKTKKKTASFTFTGTDARAVAGFQCRLDSGQFETCSAPKSYSKLKRGGHTFEVRAVDAAGNVDPTPATRTWKVKKKKRK